MKVSKKFICKRCVGPDNILLPPKPQNHNFAKQLNKNNKSASAATCQSYSEWNYLSVFALPYNISQPNPPLVIPPHAMVHGNTYMGFRSYYFTNCHYKLNNGIICKFMHTSIVK